MGLTQRLARPAGSRQMLASIVLAGGTALTVGTALLFQHVGGFIPCALCLEQRVPYYVAIPLSLVAAVAAAGRAPAWATRGLLLLVGLVMLYSLYLGAFHAGVEWGFWPGPADCAQVGGPDLSGGDLLAQMDAIRPPSCDEAAGRFAGLSFAGWNAVASALLAVVAFAGALGRAHRAV